MATVLDIKTKAIHDIQRLANTYKNKDELFQAVARQTGVSVSMVIKVYYGQRTDPGVTVLDKLVAGVNQLVERRL